MIGRRGHAVKEAKELHWDRHDERAVHLGRDIDRFIDSDSSWSMSLWPITDCGEVWATWDTAEDDAALITA